MNQDSEQYYESCSKYFSSVCKIKQFQLESLFSGGFFEAHLLSKMIMRLTPDLIQRSTSSLKTKIRGEKCLCEMFLPVQPKLSHTWKTLRKWAIVFLNGFRGHFYQELQPFWQIKPTINSSYSCDTTGQSVMDFMIYWASPLLTHQMKSRIMH